MVETAWPEIECEAPDDRREVFLLAIAGYEGPLDMLLDLARRRRVDLRAISILELAEQYLGFIRTAEFLSVELAADYLVMAAWLAYLKSGLLLPEDAEARVGAEESAALLRARLECLESMREKGQELFRRPLLGRDVFRRGAPEVPIVRNSSIPDVGLKELLAAYARARARDQYAPLHLSRPSVVPVEDAMERLAGVVRGGGAVDWSTLQSFLPKAWRTPNLIRSGTASMLVGALELARQGALELRQTERFAPILVRGRLDGGVHAPAP